MKFFIDGFNVYHALDCKKQYHKYKWLDYSKLAQSFLGGNQEVAGIVYFTALASWDPEKMVRHQLLIDCQRAKGVKIVLGKFQKVQKRCRTCKQIYETFEEKKTDVSIAIEIFRSAHEDEFDKAIIISGDSDLVPVVETVRTLFAAKQIGVIIPIGRRAEQLKEVSDFHMKMKEKHLKTSQFPDTVNVGNRQIAKPASWS